MRQLFANCERFNQPIGAWSVGRVEDMSELFLALQSVQPAVGCLGRLLGGGHAGHDLRGLGL